MNISNTRFQPGLNELYKSIQGRTPILDRNLKISEKILNSDIVQQSPLGEIINQSPLAQLLNEKAQFQSHSSGFASVALKSNGEVDAGATANTLAEAGVIPKEDKSYVKDLIDGTGRFANVPESERAKIYNEGLQTKNFRQSNTELLTSHKGMSAKDGYDAVVLDKNGEIDTRETARELHRNGIISRGDKSEVDDLLKGEGEAKHIPEEVRKEIFNRIIKHDNHLPEKGVSAGNLIEKANQLCKEGKTEELDTLLKQNGARDGGTTNNGKNTSLNGVDENFNLSSFKSYTLKGKDKNGKTVEIKVSEDDALKGGYQHGKLRGIDEALKKHGISDISELSDVQIDGRLDNNTRYKVNADQMNKIASGEKSWSDHRVKGFWEKIGDGIKNIGKGIFNVLSAPMKAMINGVTGFVDGLMNGKNPFSALGDGFGKGFSTLADGVKNGLSGVVDGFSTIQGSLAGAVFGDAFGDAIKKSYSFVAGIGTGIVTSITDGASNFVNGVNDMAQGRGNFWQNLVKAGSGAFDVATTFLGVGAAVKGVKAGVQAGKALGKGMKTAKAADTASQGLKEGAKASVKKTMQYQKQNAQGFANKGGMLNKAKSYMPQYTNPFMVASSKLPTIPNTVYGASQKGQKDIEEYQASNMDYS